MCAFALAGALTTLTVVPRASHADDAGTQAEGDADKARRARIAVRVGDRTVTVGEIEDRVAGIPAFQLATFGDTPEAALRNYTEQVVVRDLLLGAGAERAGLDKKLPTSHQLRRALSNATLRAARATLRSPAAISDDDIRRFYDENRSRFDSPERINVWRILCKSRDEAATVLATAKREPTIAKYNDLAREHSIDKATNMRGGNLGFVGPDGTSNEAGLKVDPVVVKAAQTVKDGEFVGQPIAEGENFAVVWRRGTVAPSKRTVEEASQQIRTTLFRERSEAAEKKLIDDLRAKYLHDVDTSLLGMIVLPPLDAGASLPRSIPSASKSAK